MSLAVLPRPLALFALLVVFLVIVGLLQGGANISLLLVQAVAYALIALGLNIQWGYGGLFNFGVMGFLMLGGFAVTLVSFPVNGAFWSSDGPMLLGRALLAALAGAGLIVGAHRFLHGRAKTLAVVVAWIAAYLLYRSQIDPAVAYIERDGGGWVGGLGLHPVLGWLFGGVLSAGVAYVIGKICLGLRTDYLAIATIGISEIIRALIKNMDWLTRGTLTVSPVPWPVPLPQAYQGAGISIQDSFVYARLPFLLLVVLVLALVLFLIERAYGGPWGRMMRAIRDNYVAASSMGKNVKSRQLELFIFGSILMGIGGAILVSFAQINDPSSYQPINHTFFFWVMIIVGGAGNNWGALLGALLLYVVWVISDPLSQALFRVVSGWSTGIGWGGIPEIESRALQMRVFLLGVIITVALRYAPQGLIPERIRREG